MKQTDTPLYDALTHFSMKRPYSFHVPGHKNGSVFMEKGKIHFHSLLEIDATELTGLDDLHDPSGCIAEAEELLAGLYRSKKSYLLVNGSTVGNLAMILAVCGEGDRVLVQSNCHKSIMNGLQLAGARPIFIQAQVHEQAGVPAGLDAQAVREALVAYPDIKAVILTHPNYYGMGQDLQDIITYAHNQNMPVLVDEAHGAHFCLGDPFPQSALAYGADVVVQSAHKTLPAMTMGSYLHLNSSRVQEKKLSRYLAMLQSSSPSYPIMASLDLARAFLAQVKEHGTAELMAFIAAFQEALAEIPQIQVIRAELQDPLKIVLQSRCPLNGYELQTVMEQANIYAELADPYNVLLILPLQKDERLLEAAAILRVQLQSYEVQREERPTYPVSFSTLKEPRMGYKELDQYSTMVVPLSAAEGCIAAEAIIPYPPGIPLLMKGEQIQQEHVQHIHVLLESGARFQGSAHISRKAIEVYDRRKGQ
ncbi:aminotransferase class I/II-fold pyridoxal phosphate-dependent enzyme [Ectobacillus ponti]|uniref:Aminotransferase class I/II-fold pyridoxal phosphate-dependent enzyme n=1 Tax=Ectobacillus ponti TaxID=2961894 RepID=A0AA42BV41_9BACI|nr:aminotransferase class I/II-fold pyridoxal phosphate-dependent enzyme [Ectobacillus ponti]MCP8971203.1 aminotransferase class I/II-fold pyridoxal phosphate-dependent enzyme [Ectobacillus ponti]